MRNNVRHSNSKVPKNIRNSRAQKREAKAINEYLRKLTVVFIQFVIDNKPKLSTAPGEGELLEQELVSKYLECESAWIRFAHKKFQYNKIRGTAFQENVAHNLKTHNLTFNIKSNGNQQDGKTTQAGESSASEINPIVEETGGGLRVIK